MMRIFKKTNFQVVWEQEKKIFFKILNSCRPFRFFSFVESPS